MDPNDSTISDPQEQLEKKKRLSEVADKIEHTRHVQYHNSLKRRMLRLGGFFVIFLMLVFVLHDMMVHRQYEMKMADVAERLRTYQAENGHLPSLSEFITLNEDSRNLSVNMIEYHSELILDGSPGDTLVAYTPLCRQWVMAEYHAVVKLDFTVSWVTPAELEKLIERRQQYYNQHAVPQGVGL